MAYFKLRNSVLNSAIVEIKHGLDSVISEDKFRSHRWKYTFVAATLAYLNENCKM